MLRPDRARQLRTWRTLSKGWRLDLVVPAVLAVDVLLAVLPGLVEPPQLLSPISAPMALAAVAALPTALLILATVPEPSGVSLVLAAGARRRQPELRVLALTLLALGGGALSGHGGTMTVSLLALLAEGLLVAVITGIEHCWAVPMLHLGAAALLGVDPLGRLASWAWIVDPQPSVTGYLTSVALLVTGLLSVRRIRPVHGCA